MDSFQVAAEDTTVLETSHLVEELQQSIQAMDVFPVLIGEQIAYFHDIDGGFHKEGNYDVVNLIHRVQGPDSPPNKLYSDSIELHLDNRFYNLSVLDIWQMTQTPSGLTTDEEYPQADFVLSLKVDDYMMGKQSFSEAMSANIDKREQEFSANGDR